MTCFICCFNKSIIMFIYFIRETKLKLYKGQKLRINLRNLKTLKLLIILLNKQK